MAEEKPKKGNQIIGAIAAAMGGFSLGTVIGWSSPANQFYVVDAAGNGTNSDGITKSEWDHVSSITCLGAMTAQLIIALVLPKVGPKVMMIILAPIFSAFWIMMGLVSSFVALLVGRFFTGLCGGAFCVIAPTYIGEIADKNVRGALGIMFQLLLVMGIFLEACLAYTSSEKWLSFVAAIPPLILLVVIIFLPTSPAYLIKKEKEEKARKALTFFRGKKYDISGDYKELEDYVKEGQGNFKENMKKKSSKKGFTMLMVLHIVQQLGGINAIMFHAATIFRSAAEIDPKMSNVILCAVQLVSCIITTFIVDKLGRKILWYISLLMMVVCLVMVSVYFFIKLGDPDLAETLGFFPLLFICLYVFGFCFASGPLPWAMIGEYLPAGVKNVAGPIITAVNWALAYIVTFGFGPLQGAIGEGPVFLAFAIVNALGFVFVLFFLLETKNKSLDQIQEELGK